MHLLRLLRRGLPKGGHLALKRDFAIAGYKKQLQFNMEKLLELGGVQEDSIWKWKYKGAPPPDAPAAPKREAKVS